MTLRDRIELALIAQGERVHTKTSKYLVLTRAKGGFYFVGKSGGLRAGRTASSSFTLTHTPFYKQLIAYQPTIGDILKLSPEPTL